MLDFDTLANEERQISHEAIAIGSQGNVDGHVPRVYYQ